MGVWGARGRDEVGQAESQRTEVFQGLGFFSGGGPRKTTAGGGAGSPEGAGQGSGRVFVGAEKLGVVFLGWVWGVAGLGPREPFYS